MLNSILGTELTLTSFLICTGVSLLLGVGTALVAGYRSRSAQSLAVTLAILPAVVQAVIMLVNGSIGAGIAVAGAFSLVRFRSAPGTAREIAAIFLAMAIGLATGMGYVGLAALLLAPSLAWGDDSRHYEFRLAANGEATYHAAAGDTVTVSLTLCRTTGTGPMFAMQDEICFDPAFFAYQPDGTLLREGVKTTLVTLRDGRQAVYMNCVDFGGGADWADETVVGSFQLKVLADGGASAITGSHYLVSTEDGMGRYAAAARDVTVVVSEQCRVTFQSNGGSGVAPAEVLRGTPLAPPQAPTRSGYRFTGWYSDYDLTRPWDFNAPVTADMTLYAAWQPLPAAAPSAGPWAWLIVGASISALTVLALRRRRRS